MWKSPHAELKTVGPSTIANPAHVIAPGALEIAVKVGLTVGINVPVFVGLAAEADVAVRCQGMRRSAEPLPRILLVA